MRLDKMIGNSGLDTRKNIKRNAKKGAILVNGKVVKDSSVKVDPEVDEVYYMGHFVDYFENIYMMMNKPAGFLSATENLPLISIIVEVASAFGTTGLSLGITDDLTTVGKLMIALLMFIGRIGMLYTLMIFVPKETRDLGYEYPSEKIIIG